MKDLIEGLRFNVSFNDLFLRLLQDVPEETLKGALRWVEVHNVGARALFHGGWGPFKVSLYGGEDSRRKSLVVIEDEKGSSGLWSVLPASGSYRVVGIEVMYGKAVIFVDPTFVSFSDEVKEFPGSLRTVRKNSLAT